jgi:hypothetical protein
VLAGVITPLAVRSLKTNQLPGGSTLWILSDAPSERSSPLGLTAFGALEEDLAAGVSVVPDDDVVLDAVLPVEPAGHCA